MQTHTLKRFNVRVYGLLINDKQEILVADESYRNGFKSTKFPGGGLELGEGLRDCLAREFMEETGITVTVGEHFYTTDYFQPSFFDTESQIISIYYRCHSEECSKVKVSTRKFDFEFIPGVESESFRWVPLRDLVLEETILLPIDKIVVSKLLDELV